MSEMAVSRVSLLDRWSVLRRLDSPCPLPFDADEENQNGLGQFWTLMPSLSCAKPSPLSEGLQPIRNLEEIGIPVSYTHLTLPTKRIV